MVVVKRAVAREEVKQMQQRQLQVSSSANKDLLTVKAALL